MGAASSAHHTRRSRALFLGDHGRVEELGNEALHFARWFFRSKYHLMASFMGELERPPEARDEAALRRRFCEAVTHANRVQVGRAIVTLLLAMGAATAALATFGSVAPPAFAGDVAATRFLIERIAAWSASATLLLVGLRLAFDRYLGLVDVSATFLAMQLATAKPAAAQGPPRGVSAR